MLDVQAQSHFLEPLPQLLVQIFGSNTATASYQVLNQHNDYFVLSVQMPSHEVIVKLAGRNSPMRAAFERTALIHELLNRNTDIPVSKIVAVDTTYAHFPWRYMIQTRLAGTVWADVAPQLTCEQKHNVYLQIGQAVAQLHSIQFPSFGEISAGQPETSFADALRQRAESTIQHQLWRDRFAEVFKDRRQLFEPVNQAVLCHDDLHHYNILFNRHGQHWQLAGILDFDKAWAGYGETDLARLDFWDNMMGAGFREAYTRMHIIEPDYEQRRLVYQLMWCLEYAAPTPRHRADLQRLCEALSIAPIVL